MMKTMFTKQMNSDGKICVSQIQVIINLKDPVRRTVKASYTPKHINAAAQNIRRQFRESVA